MKTFVVRATEFVEKEYIIESLEEEDLDNYFKGENSFNIDIIDERIITSNVRTWKIMEIDE